MCNMHNRDPPGVLCNMHNWDRKLLCNIPVLTRQPRRAYDDGVRRTAEAVRMADPMTAGRPEWRGGEKLGPSTYLDSLI